jgi:DNA repair protein RecN (Recombination protein N)
MLSSLSIQNFLLLERVHLTLQAGMCLLAGETGAGKSILIDALDAALGARVSLDVIRKGADRAMIEATFKCAEGSPWPPELQRLLNDEGITEQVAGELTLCREITARGSRCRVDGQLVTQSSLRQIGTQLVTIVSQHEHQRLGESEFQRHLVDRRGQHEHLVVEVQEAYTQFSELLAQKHQLLNNQQQRAREEDFYRFQLAEIEAAQLTEPNEYHVLKAERLRLVNAETLKRTCEQGYQSLYAGEQEPSLYDQASRIVHTLSEISEYDPAFKRATDSLTGVQEVIRDIASDLRQQLDSLESDPARLTQVESRLDQLTDLLRKWGPDLSAVINHADELREKLAAIHRDEAHLSTVDSELAVAQHTLEAASRALTLARHNAAEQLEKAVQDHLRELELPRAAFFVRLRPHPQGKPYRTYGAEDIEFEVSLNAGEVARSLNKTASGGEMARVLLAIQSALAAVDGVSTLVFDEVDTGISGRAARAVADKLASLARHRQVLCITHLPAVAAMADQHVHLEKQIRNEQTYVLARTLEESERIRELAAMAGGFAAPAALDHAAELRSQAQKFKSSPLSRKD